MLKLSFWVSIIRGISFLGALVAVCSYILWTQFPAKVQWADDKLRYYYVSPYHKHYEAAVRKLDGGHSQEGIQGLNLLLEDLEGVDRHDHLGNLKGKVFSRLFQIHSKTSDSGTLLAVIDKWLQFNDKNLKALYNKARLLMKIKGKETEGLGLFKRLSRISPGNHKYVIPQVEYFIASGKLREGFLFLYKNINLDNKNFKPEFPGKVWEVFWDSGSGFNGEERGQVYPRVSGGKGFKIEYKIPSPKIMRFRYDPPPLPFAWSIDNLKIHFEYKHNNKILSSKLDWGKVRVFDMEIREADLEVGNKDPYFHFDLPKIQEGTDYPVNAILIFDITRNQSIYSKILGTLVASSDKVNTLIGLLKQHGDLSELNFLLSEMKKATTH